MNAETVMKRQSQSRAATYVARVILGAALAALAYNLVVFLMVASSAVSFPYERDYGEGIVWEQMRLMFAGKGYAPIDGFPAIVFHYPPLYHATVRALSSAALIDPLMAGRLISFGATLICALLVGVMTAQLRRPDESRAVAGICGAVAGLSILTLATVESWALVMRVDMMSIALSLAGTWFGIRSMTRPGHVYAAALCFVAAFFTKQTAVAAPVAVFAMLLVVKPATAWRGIATSVLLGSVTLTMLEVTTHGGFLRHLVLYNINRFDVHELVQIPALIIYEFLFFAAVAIGLVRSLNERLPAYRGLGTWKEKRNKLAGDPCDAALLTFLFYFAVKTLMAGLLAKSGANVNYLIEWMLVGAIFAGRSVHDIASQASDDQSPARPLWAVPAVALGTTALLSGLAAQQWINRWNDRQRIHGFEQLAGVVRAAPKPVISDDMVIVLRGGKEVVWEAAIFAELASTGVWNERPFVERIRSHAFSFFITDGDRGDRRFDSRYTPAVGAAMESAYPIKCRLGEYVIHLPASATRAEAVGWATSDPQSALAICRSPLTRP